ncbi:hypothetical protein NDA13_006541 [Ustilago tritici]|nr:hypothetical protein NDA13_006541 [Ustilago tritici]
MAALGAGVCKFPERLPPTVLGLLTGLNAAAVGLVALAAFQLSKSSITDGVSRLLVLGSASFGICYHAPWMYRVLVFGGGFTTLLYDFRLGIIAGVSAKLNIREARTRSNNAGDGAQNDSTQDIELEQVNTAQRASLDKAQTPASVQELPFQVGSSLAQGSLRQRNAQTVDRTRTGTNQSTEGIDAAIVDRRTPIMVLNRYFAIGLGAFFLTFVVAIVLTRSQLNNPPRAFDFFTNMMIAGVIIFGGGPVVIPLLRGYTVENGWFDSRDFLLGFAILQAFPGPNFNFAAYLGVLSVPSNPALGAFIGWLGIFSPVGYIYTPARGAVVESTSQSGPLTSDPFWGVVASSAFVATQWFKSPPAVTIVAGAVAGLAWFGVVGAPDTERQQAFF